MSGSFSQTTNPLTCNVREGGAGADLCLPSVGFLFWIFLIVSSTIKRVLFMSDVLLDSAAPLGRLTWCVFLEFGSSTTLSLHLAPMRFYDGTLTHNQLGSLSKFSLLKSCLVGN